MKYDYIIVGAGQSGLAMAYHLKQMQANFLILDAEQEIGGAWVKRWDSLKLFTPTEFNHLPGLDFNAKLGHYPNKDEVANYFKRYVEKFNLPVTLASKVTDISQTKTGFQVSCDQQRFSAQQVIIASGPFHSPSFPACHQNLCPSIKQIHSSTYKNPQQLQPGETLVVGAGDSGYQILKEIAEHDQSRQVYFSGNTNTLTIPQELLGKTLWWWFTKLGFLSVNKYSWLGKMLSKKMQPIIGIDIKSLLNQQNVKSVGKTLDADNTKITFEKCNIDSVKNIVWATGFKPDFSWIKDIELDAGGYPVNYRGVASTPGMYFIGLPWMYTRGSATLGGVSKDAAYLANKLSLQPDNSANNVELASQLG